MTPLDVRERNISRLGGRCTFRESERPFAYAISRRLLENIPEISQRCYFGLPETILSGRRLVGALGTGVGRKSPVLQVGEELEALLQQDLDRLYAAVGA